MWIAKKAPDREDPYGTVQYEWVTIEEQKKREAQAKRKRKRGATKKAAKGA